MHPHSCSLLGKSLVSYGIYIPPIEKDHLGQLQASLTYALGKRALPVRQEHMARYLLQVELIEEDDENTGFTYAPARAESKYHFIVSNEGRLSVSARVRCIDKNTNNVLLEYCVPKERVSFDFEPDLSVTSTHEFGLGQLEMHNEAIKSAWRVMYTRLAEAIVQQVYYDLF